MFCFSAYSCVRLIASGFSVATRSQSWPSSRSATLRSGRFDAITSRALSRVAASRRRTRSVWPSRVMPPCRMSRSRSCLPADQRAGPLHPALAARHLHGRRLAEEVRQRVEEGGDDREGDQRVLPGSKAVHLLTECF